MRWFQEKWNSQDRTKRIQTHLEFNSNGFELGRGFRVTKNVENLVKLRKMLKEINGKTRESKLEEEKGQGI